MGETTPAVEALTAFTSEGTGYCRDSVYGAYVHGLFDSAAVVRRLVDVLARRRGIALETSAAVDYAALKEREYERLAAAIREHLDMTLIYDVLGVARHG